MKSGLKKKFHNEVRKVAKCLVNVDKLKGEFATDSKDLELYYEWEDVLDKAFVIIAKFADEHQIFIE